MGKKVINLDITFAHIICTFAKKQETVKWIKYTSLFLVILLLAAFIIYKMGPKATIPVLTNDIPALDIPLGELNNYVAKKEARFPNIKPENHSKIIWADSTMHTKTKYSIVYLHGFSASAKEGDPIHEDLAAHYGANLYLPRLAKHGLIEENTFLDLTVEELMDSAKEAIAIGKLLGEKVIVFSCSTGSTLGLFLTAGNPDIAAIIMYSPNVDMHDERSETLVGPWGLEILRFMVGGDFRGFEANDEVKKYWNNHYRIEGLITLKSLIKATMKPEVFKAVTQPAFVGYYYKNEEECDKIVSIPKIKKMFNQLGTPQHRKVEKPFPTVGSHVIGSKYWSEDVPAVYEATKDFLEDIVKLKSVNETVELQSH